jgi:hypothetical protein
MPGWFGKHASDCATKTIGENREAPVYSGKKMVVGVGNQLATQVDRHQLLLDTEWRGAEAPEQVAPNTEQDDALPPHRLPLPQT